MGLGGSVVAAITFGIIADDTIHFLSKYLSARRRGLSASEAEHSTFTMVGHALVTTTVVLAAGFLVFASSGFEASWATRLLVAFTIVLVLLTELLLLPALLLTLASKKSESLVYHSPSGPLHSTRPDSFAIGAEC